MLVAFISEESIALDKDLARASKLGVFLTSKRHSLITRGDTEEERAFVESSPTSLVTLLPRRTNYFPISEGAILALERAYPQVNEMKGIDISDRVRAYLLGERADVVVYRGGNTEIALALSVGRKSFDISKDQLRLAEWLKGLPP